MNEKNYSIDDIQDILDNLKKEYKSMVIQAGSQQELIREKLLLSYKAKKYLIRCGSIIDIISISYKSMQ